MNIHECLPKKKLRIAVIDDKEDVYMGVRALVEMEGEHQVDYYASTEAFLDPAKAGDYDCILLDLMFGGRAAGLDLLGHFARLGLSPPVVMMTSENKADHHTTFEMGKRGAKGLLMKPIKGYQLWEALRKAIDAQAATLAKSLAPLPHEPRQDWETTLDLEEMDPKELGKDDRALLLLRAQKRLAPDELGRLANLTLTETKVFLLRAQHDKTDKELADILGPKTCTWQTHVENAARKLGTRSVLQWRILFDKLK